MLLFGGEDNPGKVEVEVAKGDVVLVPAGVGHRLLREEGRGGLEMVGAYPKGSDRWDMCYGDGREGENEEGIRDRIGRLGWFDDGDPVYGGGEAVGAANPE